MLETNRTNANTFVVSQAVTELVANSILNEGLTLLKVASGGVNEDTQVYYFSNTLDTCYQPISSQIQNLQLNLSFSNVRV